MKIINYWGLPRESQNEILEEHPEPLPEPTGEERKSLFNMLFRTPDPENEEAYLDKLMDNTTDDQLL